MKKFFLLLTISLFCFSAGAQSRTDVFSFIESFDWGQSEKAFQKTYKNQISIEVQHIFTLKDFVLGDMNCVVVAYFDKNRLNNIFVGVSSSDNEQSVPSVLFQRASKLWNEFFDQEITGTSIRTRTGTKLICYPGELLGQVCFVSSVFYEPDLDELVNMYKLSLQDTFFGLKFGDFVTKQQVVDAVGARGDYAKCKDFGNYSNYTFKKTYFAGRKWDFVEFSATKDGRFFYFTAYNSFDKYLSYDDEKQVKETYNFLCESLEEKYGDGLKKNDDEGSHILYYGNNDITVEIYNTKSLSAGGEYRQYVGINYKKSSLSEEIHNSIQDEF